MNFAGDLISVAGIYAFHQFFVPGATCAEIDFEVGIVIVVLSLLVASERAAEPRDPDRREHLGLGKDLGRGSWDAGAETCSVSEVRRVSFRLVWTGPNKGFVDRF